MDMVVLTKYVPNPQGVADLGADFLAVREDVESALDPQDEYGVEAALRIADELGGTVTALCMGPAAAVAGIRRALAMGAHRAVHVSDERLRGSDVLATAKVLAAAIRRSPCDLIIGGTESTDGYSGTLPVAVAELLELPSATFCRKITAQDSRILAERNSEAGYDEVECLLPAVVTVTGAANEPRYPTMKGVMQAKSKEIETLSIDDLGLQVEDLVPAQRVSSIQDAPVRTVGEIIQADDDTARRIVSFLEEAKVI